MENVKHTPDRENATSIQVWINNDLLERIDAEADKDERSRAYWINKAVRLYLSRLESDRKRRKGFQ